MLRWSATAASHRGRRALHDMATAAQWLAKVSRALLVLTLWPLIFGVLALIAGLFGWYGPSTGPDNMTGQLFSLMLVLFILVMSQALLVRDADS